MSADIPEILFVDLHDAGRAQLACALVHRHSGGRVTGRSAGIDPAAEVSPTVVSTLAEWDIDISHQSPRKLSDGMAQSADFIVTMGCGDATPTYPDKRHVDWDLPDPEDEPVDIVRLVREDLDGRVKDLVRRLIPADPSAVSTP